MPHNISESAANINMLVKLDKAEIAEAKAKIYDPQGNLWRSFLAEQTRTG